MGAIRISGNHQVVAHAMAAKSEPRRPSLGHRGIRDHPDPDRLAMDPVHRDVAASAVTERQGAQHSRKGVFGGCSKPNLSEGLLKGSDARVKMSGTRPARLDTWKLIDQSHQPPDLDVDLIVGNAH